jgi:hypothetical protein
MAVQPLAVATSGYLDSPLSVAVSGYLYLGEVPTPPPVQGGGGGKGRGAFQDPREYDSTPHKLAALRAQLLNEDDEILTIVMAAVETLQ